MENETPYTATPEAAVAPPHVLPETTKGWGMMIYAKIAAAMASVDAITKDGKNVQQGYKFRGIDQVYNTVHKVFVDQQIFFTTKVLDMHREHAPTKDGLGLLNYTILKVRFRFFAQDGSYVDSVVSGEAMDSGDKSCNKALSAAMKYAMFQLLLIPTEDLPDADSQTHEMAAKVAKAPKAVVDTDKPTPEQLASIERGLANAYVPDDLKTRINAAKAGFTKDDAAKALKEMRKHVDAAKAAA
jgi:hypothetical protein